jgi:hypothetical protein
MGGAEGAPHHTVKEFRRWRLRRVPPQPCKQSPCQYEQGPRWGQARMSDRSDFAAYGCGAT